MATTEFLSGSPGLLNRGPAAQPLWVLFFSTTSSPQLVCSPTRLISQTGWTSCALSYIIVQRPPSFCGCHKLHSFNPSTVKVIFWYSSTGCTCYLHRCISYFDSPAGSEVNMQHIHTHIYIYIYIYMFIFIYAHVYVCVGACVYACHYYLHICA